MPTSLAPQRPLIHTRTPARAACSFTAEKIIPTPLHPPCNIFLFHRKRAQIACAAFAPSSLFGFRAFTGSARCPFRWPAAPAPAA